MLIRIPELIDEWFIGDNIPRRARFATKLPASIIPGIRRTKFRHQVRYAAEKSPFYRRKCKELGIDARALRTPEDLKVYFAVGYRVAQTDRFPEWRPGNEFKAKRDAMLKK